MYDCDGAGLCSALQLEHEGRKEAFPAVSVSGCQRSLEGPSAQLGENSSMDKLTLHLADPDSYSETSSKGEVFTGSQNADPWG